jgi:hypothetical protein
VNGIAAVGITDVDGRRVQTHVECSGIEWEPGWSIEDWEDFMKQIDQPHLTIV